MFNKQQTTDPGTDFVRPEDSGPFDIIGDVHGCADELETLLDKLGYGISWQGKEVNVTPPSGRRVIFVGDLVDRGPRSPDVLRIAKHMVDSGSALAVAGNHDDKFMRHLRGNFVQLTHGLLDTVTQFSEETQEFADEIRDWIDTLPEHYVLDDGKLVVVHAGLHAKHHGKTGKNVRRLCLYGEVTGKYDEYGLPERVDWAATYKGKARVVYGHTPVEKAEWVNDTICVDTGCVFGGELSALRYPELELVSVPAVKTWYESLRPLKPPRS